MSERRAVLAAMLSSSFGGMAAAVTRFLVGTVDPVTLASIRFGVGFALLLPLALAVKGRWPRGKDWIGVAGLGILFFGLFFTLNNLALRYTTAARGALAVSVLPLTTMVVASALGVEALTWRKTAGVLVAIGGAALALLAGLAEAPGGAWRGDLIMAGATLCMALYNVWSRPFILRSGPLPFVTAGMGCGAACLVAVAAASGGYGAVAGFGSAQWLAILYLGLVGGALTFYLWVWALKRATPTQVASTITLNPVSAALLASAILGEPIGVSLVGGVVAVFVGIWIASSEPRARVPALDT